MLVGYLVDCAFGVVVVMVVVLVPVAFLFLLIGAASMKVVGAFNCQDGFKKNICFAG